MELWELLGIRPGLTAVIGSGGKTWKLRIDSEDSTTASFHKPEQPENPNDARLPVYPMKSRTIPFPSFCPCSSDKEADHAAGRFFRPKPSMKKTGKILQ